MPDPDQVKERNLGGKLFNMSRTFLGGTFSFEGTKTKVSKEFLCLVGNTFFDVFST